ncbi:MAG: UDP-3-O-(3-hydroxymyristoyl)glucosamine N-acyltransferase [Spartobacteria bacterium]|nr:UDP-3-O-(3-hydroxymyristoyl)glucosamine N-acyltransferase [Spartobacteria bacterium]
MTCSYSAQQLADRFQLEVVGRSDVMVRGVEALGLAGPSQVSFLANKKYKDQVPVSKAGIVIVSCSYDGGRGDATTLLLARNPDKTFGDVAELFAPLPRTYAEGVHPSAVVASSAELGRNVSVGPHCVVEEGAILGDGCVLVAQCYIGHHAKLGCDCRMYPMASVREECVVGDRVIMHNGAVVGSDGFGYAVNEDGSRTKIRQLGIVEVGDDVEIGANTTIDRARFGKTAIGRGVKIDNLVQIGHNAVIEDHVVIVSQVGISGSTVVGAHAVLAGQAGIAGHLHIGKGAIIGGQSAIIQDVPAGKFMFGSPAVERSKAMRNHVLTQRLGEMVKKINALEKALMKIKER